MVEPGDITVWRNLGPYRSDVLTALTRYVRAIAVVDRVAIFLRSEDDPGYMVAVAGVPEDVIGRRIPVDAGIPGKVLEAGEPVVVASYQEFEKPLQYTGTEELQAGADVPLRFHGAVVGTLSAYSVEPGREFTSVDVALLTEAAAIGGVALEHAAMRERVEQTLTATVRAMAVAVDMRDAYTAEHSRDVVRLAVEVGRRLGLNDAVLRDLEFGALLHDIGKLGIPDAVLQKPSGLDEREWETIKRHPALGEMILLEVPGLERVAHIVRSEHEHFDGSGYPDGLAGDDIPLESRIILVCDAYHAMTSDRPYRAALGYDEAVRRISEGSGAQFCPEAAEALLDVLATEHAHA